MSGRESKHNEVDEEQLKDAYTGSFIIGGVVFLIWLAVFLIYINRL